MSFKTAVAPSGCTELQQFKINFLDRHKFLIVHVNFSSIYLWIDTKHLFFFFFFFLGETQSILIVLINFANKIFYFSYQLLLYLSLDRQKNLMLLSVFFFLHITLWIINNFSFFLIHGFYPKKKEIQVQQLRDIFG